MDAAELGAGWFIHSLALTLYWDPLAKWGACSSARTGGAVLAEYHALLVFLGAQFWDRESKAILRTTARYT